MTEPGAPPPDRQADLHEGQDQLAGTGQRVVGALADLFVAGAAFATPLVLFRGAYDFEDPATAAGLQLASVAFFFVYEVVPTALWGRTAGKLIVGTRVVRQSDGRLPGWKAAVLRWALPALAGRISGPLGLLVGVGLRATLVFDPLRRGVHDRLAGTIVVRAEPGTAVELP